MDNSLKLKANISGKGALLLLVPGGLTGWNSWEPFVEFFTDNQRKVLRVQLLNVEYGFERQPLPPNYSVRTESQALTATLDSLGYTDPIDVVAWSYGALVTLDYALDHPDRIRTLTLIEPPAIWALLAHGPMDLETHETISFFKTLHGEITEDMLAKFIQYAGLATHGQSPRELPQWQQWIPFRQALCNSPAIIFHKDELKRLQDFHSPVLLVTGKNSAQFLRNIIEILASNLHDVRVVELSGGHASHIESREKFLDVLERFHNKTEKKTSRHIQHTR